MKFRTITLIIFGFCLNPVISQEIISPEIVKELPVVEPLPADTSVSTGSLFPGLGGIPQINDLLPVLPGLFELKEEGKISLLELSDLRRRNRKIPIKVYHTHCEGRQPVILFSHTVGGSRESSAYLGNYWAKEGFTAVFIQHPGSDEVILKSVPERRKPGAMKKLSNFRQLINRIDDVSFVIDQLKVLESQPDHEISGAIDTDKIGMSGHGFGGIVGQMLMGQQMSSGAMYTDSRVDAFCLLSPTYPRMSNAIKSFSMVTRPALCISGSNDRSPIDPVITAASRAAVFNSLPASRNKYGLVLSGANHLTLAGNQVAIEVTDEPSHQDKICQMTTRFWNAWLKDDAEAKQWLGSGAPNEENLLAKRDSWKWR